MDRHECVAFHGLARARRKTCLPYWKMHRTKSNSDKIYDLNGEQVGFQKSGTRLGPAHTWECTLFCRAAEVLRHIFFSIDHRRPTINQIKYAGKCQSLGGNLNHNYTHVGPRQISFTLNNMTVSHLRFFKRRV